MKVPSTVSEYPKYEIPRFTGINLTAEHSEMEDTECALLQNYYQESKFVWKQRGGQTKWNPATISINAERVLAFKEYIPTGGTRRLIAVVKEGAVDKVYQAPYSTKVFAEVTGATALTHSETWSIVQWLDNLYISNGIENIQVSTNGTTRADIVPTGSNRKGSIMTIWQDRLVVAGDPVDPSAIYFSNTLAPTNFDVANVIYVGRLDGDTITALATTGVNTNLGAPTGELIIFKSRSMWVFTGNIYGYASNPSLSLISSVVGCSGNKAFAHTPIGLIWVGKDGIYTSLNAGYPERIDAKVRGLFTGEAGLFTTPIDLSAGNRIALGYSTNLSHMKITYRPQGASTNTDQIWCDLRDVRDTGIQWCGTMKGQVLSCFLQDSDGAMLAGSDNSGFIYTVDSGFTDDGTTVVTKLITKNFNLQLRGIEKVWRKFRWKLDIYGQTLLTSEIFINYGTSYLAGTTQGTVGGVWDSGVWDTALWGSPNKIAFFSGRLPVLIGANAYFVLQGTSNATNQHEVIDLTIEFQKKRDFIW